MTGNIADIGEFGVINRIKKRIRTDSSVVKGIGDDCAVIDRGGNTYTLLTCDMIVEGVDFKRGERFSRVGRKALAVSLSDIAACGGIPRWCLVSVGMPKLFSTAAVDALYKGLADLAKVYKVNLVGGDISNAPVLTIDLSLYGEVEKKNLVLRNGARIGDVIFVTGSFGGSIRGKHLMFTPRLKESRFLVNNYKVHAMIDCSDGLAADLGHIITESDVGCVVFEHLVPQSNASRGIKDALFSGEDFELIFTVDEKEARRIIATTEFEFFPVGSITARQSGARIIDKNGVSRKLDLRGYRHF